MRCLVFTAVCLVIDALWALSKRRQDKVRFAFFWDSVETLRSSRCRAHRGRQDVAPSSERVWNSFQRHLAALKECDALWGSMWPLLVVVMFYFVFFWTIWCKKTGRGNEATEEVFRIGNCESYTRPISTNPGSMEAREYRLTRGTCLLACRLELDAVAGLL